MHHAPEVPALRFHDLRHTFATLALSGAEGVSEADIKVISESMGHADVAITLRVYAHLLPARRTGLAARMDQVLFATRGETAAPESDEASPPQH